MAQPALLQPVADTEPTCDAETYANGRWWPCAHTSDRIGEDIEGALVTYCQCCTDRDINVRGRCSGASDEEREEAAEAPCYCGRPNRYCICP